MTPDVKISASHYALVTEVDNNVIAGGVLYQYELLSDAVFSAFKISLVFDASDVEAYDDIEIWVSCHSWSLEMAPFDGSYTIYYWCSIVTMALSYCFKIKWHISGKSQFFHMQPTFYAPIKEASSKFCGSILYT